MTEVAVRQSTVGAFDPYNEKIVKYLGLDRDDPKSVAVVAVARRYDLDPLLKHVVIVEAKGKANIYITRDGLLHVAHQSGVLDGIVVDQEPTLSEDGKEWVARVSVWRKDMGHPFTFPGRYPVSGSNKEYPQEMALKAAESHALRRAFSVAGLPSYDEQRAEHARARAVPAAAPVTAADIIGETVVPAEQPTGGVGVAAGEPAGHAAEQGDPEKERRRLFAILGELGVTDRDERLAVYSAIVGQPIQSTKDLDVVSVRFVTETLDPITRYSDEHKVDEVGGLIVEGKRIRAGVDS